jgi:hypothetical protein
MRDEVWWRSYRTGGQSITNYSIGYSSRICSSWMCTTCSRIVFCTTTRCWWRASRWHRGMDCRGHCCLRFWRTAKGQTSRILGWSTQRSSRHLRRASRIGRCRTWSTTRWRDSSRRRSRRGLRRYPYSRYHGRSLKRTRHYRLWVSSRFDLR